MYKLARKESILKYLNTMKTDKVLFNYFLNLFLIKKKKEGLNYN